MFGNFFLISLPILSAHPNWDENKAEIPTIWGWKLFNFFITSSSFKPNSIKSPSKSLTSLYPSAEESIIWSLLKPYSSKTPAKQAIPKGGWTRLACDFDPTTFGVKKVILVFLDFLL